MAKRVVLIGLGGTIASVEDSEGQKEPKLAASRLLDGIRKRSELRGIDISVVDMKRVTSREISLRDMWELAATIRREASNGVDGVVVTQGTDTLEETAYALALQLQRECSVVLTGAMRTSDQLGSDGPANLVAAFRVAADVRMADYGPVVLMNDEVHLARWVQKTHSTLPNAFTSPHSGAIGYLTEGRVILLGDGPQQPDVVGFAAEPPAVKVDLIWVATGADGRQVKTAIPFVDALVVAGIGGGHVPPKMVPALVEAISSGVPVVLATRCLSGPVLTSTYKGRGSEIDLIRNGLVPAGHLSALKARLRGIFGLAMGASFDDLFPVW